MRSQRHIFYHLGGHRLPSGIYLEVYAVPSTNIHGQPDMSWKVRLCHAAGVVDIPVEWGATSFTPQDVVDDCYKTGAITKRVKMELVTIQKWVVYA